MYHGRSISHQPMRRYHGEYHGDAVSVHPNRHDEFSVSPPVEGRVVSQTPRRVRQLASGPPPGDVHSPPAYEGPVIIDHSPRRRTVESAAGVPVGDNVGATGKIGGIVMQ